MSELQRGESYSGPLQLIEQHLADFLAQGDTISALRAMACAGETATGGVKAAAAGVVSFVLDSIMSPLTPWGRKGRVPLEADILELIPVSAPPPGFIAALDFMCLWKKWALRHDVLKRIPGAQLMLPFMHAMSHCWPCTPGMSFVLQVGSGWAVLEDCERFWSRIYQLLHTTRYATGPHRVANVAAFVHEMQVEQQLKHAALLVRMCIADEKRALRELRSYVAMLTKVATVRSTSASIEHWRVDAAIADLKRRADEELFGRSTRYGTPSTTAAQTTGDEAMLERLGRLEVTLSALVAMRVLASPSTDVMSPSMTAAIQDHIRSVLPSALSLEEAAAQEAKARADHHKVHKDIVTKGVVNRVGESPSWYLATIEADLLRRISSRLMTLIGHRERKDAAVGAKARAAVTLRNRSVKKETIELWARVVSIHPFTPPAMRSIVLPVIDFARAPADIMHTIFSVFAGCQENVVGVAYSDLLALQAGRLMRAWEQRSLGRFSLLAAREMWGTEAHKLSMIAADLQRPFVAEAGIAGVGVEAALGPEPSLRVADYTPSASMLQHPACRLALAQQALEGFARASMLFEDSRDAFAYVTSARFTNEALNRRRGNQGTLVTWVDTQGWASGVPVDAPLDDARAHGVRAPAWAGGVR